MSRAAISAFDNPLTMRKAYGGTIVSRAARIEPITPQGHVYAGREFAALAASENVKEFTCDYVGLTPLAKQFGARPCTIYGALSANRS